MDFEKFVGFGQDEVAMYLADNDMYAFGDGEDCWVVPVTNTIAFHLRFEDGVLVEVG